MTPSVLLIVSLSASHSLCICSLPPVRKSTPENMVQHQPASRIRLSCSFVNILTARNNRRVNQFAFLNTHWGVSFISLLWTKCLDNNTLLQSFLKLPLHPKANPLQDTCVFKATLKQCYSPYRRKEHFNHIPEVSAVARPRGNQKAIRSVEKSNTTWKMWGCKAICQMTDKNMYFSQQKKKRKHVLKWFIPVQGWLIAALIASTVLDLCASLHQLPFLKLITPVLVCLCFLRAAA